MSHAKQSTGNYGEKRVLKELARLGWAAINANELRYNMPGYDIIAHRPIYGSLTFDMALSADRKIFISVKTRGPTSNHFQIGGFKRSEIIEPLSYDPKQFTILVSKADQPEDDSFYVMPSHVVRAECAERQRQIWERRHTLGIGSYQMHLNHEGMVSRERVTILLESGQSALTIGAYWTRPWADSQHRSRDR